MMKKMLKVSLTEIQDIAKKSGTLGHSVDVKCKAICVDY